MNRLLIIIGIFLVNFSISYASVQITEVMYNPDGADTNREWIEIYNNGSSSIDIGSWYFYENDTYHGLYPDGFTNLGAGEYAIFAKDVNALRAELGSGINYIKSSFSLNNTGESLIIADENKIQIDSYLYNAENGGNGDGKSLQLVGSSWTAASPTPGLVNNESSSSGNDNPSQEEPSTIEPSYVNYYKPYIYIPNNIVAQSNFDIRAEIIRIKGSNKTRTLSGYYNLNFGDGNFLESDERIEHVYSYRNPGKYLLVFEYHRSIMSFENGDEPDAVLKKEILILPHNISIKKVDAFGGIILENNTNTTIDISDWKVIWNNKKYSFPRNSYLLENSEMTILYENLGFSPTASKNLPIQLLSNSYKPIDYYPKYKKNSTSSSNKIFIDEGFNIDDVAKGPDALVFGEDVEFFGKTDPYLEQYLLDNPDKIKVDFGENNNQLPIKNKGLGLMYYALGALVLMLGIARFTKHRHDSKNIENDKTDFGTIEVIE